MDKLFNGEIIDVLRKIEEMNEKNPEYRGWINKEFWWNGPNKEAKDILDEWDNFKKKYKLQIEKLVTDWCLMADSQQSITNITLTPKGLRILNLSKNWWYRWSWKVDDFRWISLIISIAALIISILTFIFK